MSVAVQKKRGPKPKHIAPSADDLCRAIDLHDHLEDVMRHYGIGRKTLYRWMTERDIPLPQLRIRRPHGVTPAFVRLARTPGGRIARARLYNIWDKMKKRCHRVGDDDYKHYGAKGIRVCAEWLDSYDAFREWAVSHGYAKDLTLDRIRNAEGYGPGNCRWATREEQTYNSCRVHSLTLNGVTKLLPIWAKELGLSPFLLRTRRSSGWTDEQILTTPLLTNGQSRPGVLRGRAAAKAKATLISNDSEPNR